LIVGGVRLIICFLDYKSFLYENRFKIDFYVKKKKILDFLTITRVVEFWVANDRLYAFFFPKTKLGRQKKAHTYEHGLASPTRMNMGWQANMHELCFKGPDMLNRPSPSA